jgi:hypothetical protein
MPWCIHSLGRIYNPSVHQQVEGTKWALGVAEPYTAGRLKAAWWVLTGKAFAFAWPKAGELEKAIGMPLWDRAKTARS